MRKPEKTPLIDSNLKEKREKAKKGPDPNKRKRLKKLLLWALILLSLLFCFAKISSWFWQQKKERFPPQKIIAQVGRERLFGRDLNYELRVYFPKFSKSKDPLPDSIKKKALEQIIEKSLLLQMAAEEGLISLEKTVFDNPNKDYRARNLLINSLKEKVEDKFVNWVRGEAISIWFKNIYEPKMGVEAARQITRTKMENIYQRLKKGELASLKEAAEVIRGDPSLGLIDPSYKGNAYLSFEITQDEDFFIDPKIQEMAFKLPPGQLSPILIGRDRNPGGEFYECCFIVLKVLERRMRGFASFEDWFDQKRRNYEVEIRI